MKALVEEAQHVVSQVESAVPFFDIPEVQAVADHPIMRETCCTTVNGSHSGWANRSRGKYSRSNWRCLTIRGSIRTGSRCNKGEESGLGRSVKPLTERKGFSIAVDRAKRTQMHLRTGKDGRRIRHTYLSFFYRLRSGKFILN